MRLLVLGGTRFLGRHLVEAALARGDDVTIFSRGRTPLPWPGRVSAQGRPKRSPPPLEGEADREAVSFGGGSPVSAQGRSQARSAKGSPITALAGDRDPRVAPGLAALESGTWDAVVDCSGYVPRVVEAGARLLAPRVGRYVFVSSMSVYAKTERPGMDETTPLATLADPAAEAVTGETYGALKAGCEAAVERVFGVRATNVRPGLIVGPFDSTDRFGYWVARFVHPHLLGDRPARAVVPAPPERPVQFIDARDLATWLLDIAERDLPGALNACSPAWEWRMSTLVQALRTVASAPPRPAWIDDEELVAHGVTPWTGLPLWLPPSEPDSVGFMAMDCSRAQRAGLATRPLVDTVRDTAHWLAARDNADTWKQVLTADAERAILAL